MMSGEINAFNEKLISIYTGEGKLGPQWQAGMTIDVSWVRLRCGLGYTGAYVGQRFHPVL